jgi:hypothetical protein
MRFCVPCSAARCAGAQRTAAVRRCGRPRARRTQQRARWSRRTTSSKVAPRRRGAAHRTRGVPAWQHATHRPGPPAPLAPVRDPVRPSCVCGCVRLPVAAARSPPKRSGRRTGMAVAVGACRRSARRHGQRRRQAVGRRAVRPPSPECPEYPRIPSRTKGAWGADPAGGYVPVRVCAHVHTCIRTPTRQCVTLPGARQSVHFRWVGCLPSILFYCYWAQWMEDRRAAIRGGPAVCDLVPVDA